ncbi:MAG: trypsin-like peptidase domain-containing protein [Candidatus Ornithomonoglobus sp.]
MKKSNLAARLLSIFAVTGLVASMAAVPASAEVTDIASAKNGVVLIMDRDATGYGSGFAIGDPKKPVEYIATACHCVAENYGQADMTVPNTATVYFSAAANKAMVANVWFYDTEKDIAVLKLPEPTTEREALRLCPYASTDLSDTVAALGYPAVGVEGSDYRKFDVTDIIVTKGGIKKADRVNEKQVYLMDLVLEHGNSGGPIVNSKGEVIGMAVNKIAYDESTAEMMASYALTIDELIKAIDTEEIAVDIVGNGGISPLLLGILGGVLVLIIVLIVVLLVVRKSKGASNEVIQNQIPSEAAPSANVTAPIAPVAPKKSARLVAINGYLNGKTFNISGSAKIGRDSAKCPISFPVNTKGISGVHCEITYDGKVCYITDLKSSYGTFVNGNKLIPNTPTMLKSGAKFYLAAPENMFEIRY